MVKYYVQTRAHARTLDYDWLGERPEDRWWEKYRAYTFFKHPTLIVEGYDHRWRLYASGIPSTRQDAVGSHIRHVVMLEGSESDKDEAYRVLGTALLESDKLGQAIDEQLDEDFVVRCLSEPSSHAAEVAKRIEQVVEALPSSYSRVKPVRMSPGQVVWCGAKSKHGLDGLLRRAASLIEGSTKVGLAALLNLIRDESTISADLAEQGAVAFLVGDSQEGSWRTTSSKAGSRQLPPNAGKYRRLIRKVLILAALAVGVAVYVMYRYIIYGVLFKV